MKQTDIITLGLVGVAVWLILQAKKTTPAGKLTTSGTGYASEIMDAGGGQFGNGWRYFSDGTSIDPEGNYYLGGQRVYTASGTTA